MWGIAMLEYQTLRGIYRADAAIIGGGAAGLMTAAMLSQSGMKTAVLEAGRPGFGHSPTIPVEANPDYTAILQTAGEQAACQYARALCRTVSTLMRQLTPFCPVHKTQAYTYALLPRDLPALHEHISLMRHIGQPAQIAPDAGGCPFPVELSAFHENALLLEADSLTEGLLKRIYRSGGRVFSNTLVIGLQPGQVHTAAGRVQAPLVILCCGKVPGQSMPELECRTRIHCLLHGGTPLFTLQRSIRPGGLALTPVPGGIDATFCAGRTGAPQEQERISLFLRILRCRLPDFTPAEAHFSQTVHSPDGLPLIGETDLPGRILMACGISSFIEAAHAAQVLARYILGHPQPEDVIYRPQRGIPWSRPVFRRHLNAFRRRAPRCSLCRAPLRWCDGASWWGCPQCGSAFGLLGKRISGPAVRDTQASARQRPGW